MGLVDAHIHLTDKVYSEYLNFLLAGIRAMDMMACSVSVDVATSIKGLELFKQERDIVKNFAGIHPEAASREDLDEFKALFSLNVDKIDGVGEIGLDRTYDERGIAPYDKQKLVFAAMLQLAESKSKPVSIHSRKALDDILSILPSYNLRGVLLHWFAGSKKQLAQAADMGLYVAFGPALVYSDDKKVLLQNTPRERILVETDGPVTFSHCFENLPASPTSFLVSVVSAAARVVSLDFDELVSVLEKNSLSYLST
ncbi:MAG: TatD family hydrolase [Nitrososphaera sp.]